MNTPRRGYSPSVRDLDRRLRESDRNFVGPRQSGYHINPHGLGGGSVSIRVDLGPAIDEIKDVLNGASRKVRTIALQRALNHQSAQFFTAVKRNLAAQTSAKAGRVAKALRETKARAGHLEYRIDAKDTAIPLNAFLIGRKRKTGSLSHKAGPVLVPVIRAWRKQRTLKGAFVLPNTNFVMKRVGKGKRKIKPLYGPIIPKEMLRPDDETFQFIKREMPKRVQARILHELGFAFSKGG